MLSRTTKQPAGLPFQRLLEGLLRCSAFAIPIFLCKASEVTMLSRTTKQPAGLSLAFAADLFQKFQKLM